MPADPPAGGGGGSFLTAKFLGIPALVWIAGVAAIAYWLYYRNSAASGGAASSTAGANDTLTTGDTTVDSGAVSISIDASGDTGGSSSGSGGGGGAGGGGGGTGGQPTPPVTGKATTVTVPNIVGKPGATALDQLKTAGLVGSQSPKTTPKGRATTVKTQSPAGGAKVAKGSTVKDTVTVNPVNKKITGPVKK